MLINISMVEDMGSILQKVGFFFSVIGNRISNTSYHLQYLYCQGGYVFGAKANLITFVAEFFLSAYVFTLTAWKIAIRTAQRRLTPT